MTIALKRSTAAAAALTVSAVLLTGCAGGFTGGDKKSDDKKTEASTSAAQGDVDLASLDTGKYPTKPRPEFGKPSDDEILAVEGQRMAQFVLLPFEVDEDLTEMSMLRGVITGKGATGRFLSPEVRDVPANDELMYGYQTGGQTPDSSIRSGDSKDLTNVGFRYLTPASAAAAAQQMGGAADGTPITLKGAPDNTYAVTGEDSDGDPHISAFTSVKNFVVHQWYQVPAKDKDQLEKNLVKGLNDQVDLISKFPAALTKDEAKAQGITGSTRPLMDQNKVLIYALPFTDAQLKEQSPMYTATMRAVYGPRGMAQLANNPKEMYELLDEVGATANATEESYVYRAKTKEGADKIMSTFVADKKSEGDKEKPSPEGLPDVKCFEGTHEGAEGGDYDTCFIKNGRYFAEVTDDKSLKQTHQKAAAQYVILTQADQKAE